MPLSTTPRVMRHLLRHQRSHPLLWPIALSGVLGLCNVALVWHLLTALKADIDNDRPAQVKGAEIVLWPVDYPRILRIVKDMEAAIQKHDLTETFAAWSFPNVPDMDRARIEALANTQQTLAGLPLSATKDILGALYLPRDDKSHDTLEDGRIMATESWVYTMILTGQTTHSNNNDDPTVLNGTWKEAFTKASVAQLLVSMGRDKAARLHLNQMAEAAEAAILSTHWASAMYVQVRQVLQEVDNVRKNPDLDQMVEQLGNMGVQEPTIAQQLVKAMASMTALTVQDDNSLLHNMLRLAAADDAQ